MVIRFLGRWVAGWNYFWFAPRSATSIGLMRIIVGCCVIYNLLVWSLELSTFVGPEGMLPTTYRELYFGQTAWSHFDWLPAGNAFGIVHGIAIGIAVLFTLGVGTRFVSLLTAAIVISYANRATGALFGFDQVLVMLCLYLAVGNSGGAFSVDRWWQNRKKRGIVVESLHERPEQAGGESVDAEKKWLRGAVSVDQLTGLDSDGAGEGSDGFWRAWSGWDHASVSTNVAIRLIQLHLCLIYFYAGLGKLQGETWWTGQAIWFSVASYEYQTMDLTWLSDHMGWVAFLTLVTVYWEVTYPALIWSRLTRPFVLLIALLTHLGIGLAMGMMTFGLIMLVANFSFVELGSRPIKRHLSDS